MALEKKIEQAIVQDDIDQAITDAANQKEDIALCEKVADNKYVCKYIICVDGFIKQVY